MPAHDFKIVFDRIDRIYFPGQCLRGQVCLTFTEPKTVKALKLQVDGQANVHWSTGSGKNRRQHYGREIYLNANAVLFSSGAGDSVVVAAGESVYPFEILLPPTLPATFFSPIGQVGYTVQAILDRPWKLNQSVKEPFSIATILDLNNEPSEYRELLELAGDEVVSCYCCFPCCACTERGGVDARVAINKRCFVPGESIVVNGRVTNNTSSTLPLVRAALRKTITYTANATYKTVKSDESYEVAVAHPNIGGGQVDEWSNVTLLVPPLQPSRHDGCGIIDINYAFEFWVTVGTLTRLQLQAPVIIGSVALGGGALYPPPPETFYPPPPGAFYPPPSGTFYPPLPGAPVVTTQPPGAAPPLSDAYAPPSYDAAMQ